MANKRWTDEDVEDLRNRLASGQGVPGIARELGRSQEATRARMQLLGLTKPRQFKTADVPAAHIPALSKVADFAEQ